MENKIPSILERTLEKFKENIPNEPYGQENTEKAYTIKDAELVTSQVVTPDGTLVGHAPVLDIDGINISLVPSTTPGNYHLYIDKVMTWGQYSNLLSALYQAGIIEYEFFQLAIQRQRTAVRLPWIKKEMSEEDRRVRDVRARLKADPDFPDEFLMDINFSKNLREKVRKEIEAERKK